MIRIILTDICYLLKKQWLIFIVLVLSIACSFLVFSMMTGVINYEISAAKSQVLFTHSQLTLISMRLSIFHQL